MKTMITMATVKKLPGLVEKLNKIIAVAYPNALPPAK